MIWTNGLRVTLFMIGSVFGFAGAASGTEVLRPSLTLESQATSNTRSDYAAVSLSYGDGRLSFGRPRSALDNATLTGVGPALSLFRSRADRAAGSGALGGGLLIEAPPIYGLTLSSSVHDAKGSDDPFVALSAQYESPELGPIDRMIVYGGAEDDGKGDVFRLGTSLTRGAASAGIDFTTERGPTERTISGVYFGLDVTVDISVAVSGEVESLADASDLPPRLGFGAAYEFGRGQILSGSIGDATGDDPRFGFMLGLQF